MSTAATDLPEVSGKTEKPPLRFVTAASLFDGHDAAINIMRRLIQAQGAEVIHLGHNRSVDDIVRAAIQEDVDGIAVSSYQGGTMNFSVTWLIDSPNWAQRTSRYSAVAVAPSRRRKSAA
jgi:methylmalonyl-CoA mutase